MAELSDDYDGRLNWQPAVNQTSEDIPPFACVRFFGSTHATGTRPPVLMIGAHKPDDYGAQYHHRIAWHQVTRPGAVGYFALPHGSPILARVDPRVTPNPGELWGPIASSWELHKDARGFRVVGFPSGGLANRNAVLVLFEPLLSLTATLDEDLEQGTTVEATADDSGETFEVKEDLGGLTEAIAVGTRVRVQWDVGKQLWVVIAAACIPSAV
mgnify:CR=1 FL=1